MMLKNIYIIAIASVFVAPLTSCQEIGEGSRMAAKSAKKSVQDTQDALERVFGYRPADEEYKPIPYTFCYQVMQDINCYNQPLPEARGRLVGWQGRGEFRIKDAKNLPAKTALVRQPRKADWRKDPVKKILEKEKVEKPEIVNLEPVYIPEPPKVQGDDKVVTIKIGEQEDDNLY